MAAKRHSLKGEAEPTSGVIDRGSGRSTEPYLRRHVYRAGKGAWRVVITILTVLTVFSSLPTAHADVDPASVQRAIDRGVDYLKKTQNDRGGWSEFRNQSCGLSSLCTLALLNAGVDRDDPDVVRALRYLRGFNPKETYSVSLQTLVYCQAGAAGDLPRIRENVEWLIRGQISAEGGAREGAWAYGVRGPGSGDPSNAQFALLALGAAVDRGVEVEADVFRRAAEFWRRRQQRSGGWAYSTQGWSTGSMTCAGIASLIIARGRLQDAGERIEADDVACCDTPDSTDAVAQGLGFLSDSFSVRTNPGDSFNYFYYMYALERVGRLSGQRLIGGHDWYREGAEQLISLQDNFQGFWSGGNFESDRNIATSFALLFLSKGKRQVVAGRLRHDGNASPGDWQRHPDSIRQLVRHLERDWGRDLTWQTVDGDNASVEDLLQTPVLVIGGTGPLDLSPDLVERLGDYLNQGGTILFDGDAGDGCGDIAGLERSVRELCEQWFEGATLEELPPNHPVWFAEHRVDPTSLGEDFWIRGVQACCRTPVFFAPRSLSCRWQLGGELFRRSDTTSGARTQVEAAVRIGENIVAYATGRELKDKLQRREVLQAGTIDEAGRGVIPIARLDLGAGGEQARRALPNAVEIIRARVPIEVAAVAQPVALTADNPTADNPTADNLADVPVLWVHGQTEFRLSADQREQIRAFVENGGFVIATSICGSDAFTEAFRREFPAAIPDMKTETMKPDHPALGESYGGFDLRRVSVRDPSTGGRTLTVNRREQPPTIEVGTLAGIDAVFFSPLDLSCALESQNAVQCPGYDTDDAAKLVANLLLYALQQ